MSYQLYFNPTFFFSMSIFTDIADNEIKGMHYLDHTCSAVDQAIGEIQAS